MVLYPSPQGGKRRASTHVRTPRKPNPSDSDAAASSYRLATIGHLVSTFCDRTSRESAASLRMEWDDCQSGNGPFRPGGAMIPSSAGDTCSGFRALTPRSSASAVYPCGGSRT